MAPRGFDSFARTGLFWPKAGGVSPRGQAEREAAKVGDVAFDVESFVLSEVDAAFARNPYPAYAALQDQAPFARQPDGSFFVSRYADASEILGDATRFRSDKKVDFLPKFGKSPLYEHHTTSLVFNDPPYHTRVRKLLAPFFTPRTLAVLEPGVTRMVEDLLDRAADQGTFDIVNEFAATIPLNLIGDMLGVPRDERDPLRDWAAVILGGLEPVRTPEELAAGDQAVRDFKLYLSDLIAEKKRSRATRQDTDILGALIDDYATGEGLSEVELIHNCIFLLNAGHDTTTSLIANGMDLLLRFPDQMARLRKDPSLMKTAIEEMLRYESPLQIGNRRAAEDVTLSGQVFPAGTFFHIGIAAANHDPRQFPDPEAFDIARKPNKHLAFGTGIHTCAGNSVARMEGRLAFGTLLERFATIERAGPTVRPHRSRFRVIDELRVSVKA